MPPNGSIPSVGSIDASFSSLRPSPSQSLAQCRAFQVSRNCRFPLPSRNPDASSPIIFPILSVLQPCKSSRSGKEPLLDRGRAGAARRLVDSEQAKWGAGASFPDGYQIGSGNPSSLGMGLDEDPWAASWADDDHANGFGYGLGRPS